jgi:hypothetical protein
MLWKVPCVSGRRVGHGSAVYPGTRARPAGGRRRPGPVGRAYRAAPGAPVRGGLRFAFYGRVSTQDWQDPVTSRARQRDQAGVWWPGTGLSWLSFFDSGHSRTLPWARRPQAAALVAALASTVVVRCVLRTAALGRSRRACTDSSGPWGARH